MNMEFLPALAIFAFVASMTPGPNNLMLMASGVNFGFVRTIPHMLGVLVGFAVMFALVGVGLVQVFDAYPTSYLLLKTASVVYLVYLAWKIATAAGPSDEPEAGGKPLTFLQAALFQWVNPKAWAVALTALTVYSTSRSVNVIMLVCLVFILVTIPAVTAWTYSGQQLRKLLNSRRRLRVFNAVMASLLVATLFPVLLSWLDG